MRALNIYSSLMSPWTVCPPVISDKTACSPTSRNWICEIGQNQFVADFTNGNRSRANYVIRRGAFLKARFHTKHRSLETQLPSAQRKDSLGKIWANGTVEMGEFSSKSQKHARLSQSGWKTSKFGDFSSLVIQHTRVWKKVNYENDQYDLSQRW